MTRSHSFMKLHRNKLYMGDPLIFRHMLICGSTGTGKTFLSKNILRQFMSLIVDNKLSTTGKEAIKETPIILALDEAHRYLSNANGEHSRLIISRFADAARQGRKEGLGLFLITQDPQDIDDTVFKQVNTKLILNLNNDAAITSLKVPKEYERRIPYLKKGQMIIHSPDNSDIVEIIGLSNCVVRHR